MLSKFSVKKPFTVVVSIIIVLILGAVSYLNMSIDLLPNMNMPYAIVMTTYVGAAPEEVEKAVSIPIEKSMASINNVAEIQSVSNENYSMVIMEFSQTADMDSAIIEMREALDLIKMQLPENVGATTIMKINPNMLPTMLFSVSAQGKTSTEVAEYISDKIIPEFERLEGVASVSANGLVDNMIYVELSGEKLAALEAKLEGVFNEKVENAIAEGNKTFEGMKNNLVAKTQAAYAKQTQAKMVESEISTTVVKATIEELKILISEKITQFENEIRDANSGNTKELDMLVQIKQALENNDIAAAAAALGTFSQSEISKSINELKNNINSALQSIFPNEIGESIRDMIETAMAKAMKSATVTAKTAEYAALYGEYIALSEEASTAKITMLIAASSAKSSSTSVDFSGFKINKETIANLLKAQNFDMPAGSIQDGNGTFVVRTGDEIGSIEELRGLPLLNVPTFGNIYLSDVAEVIITDNSSTMYSKVGGENAVVLSVSKQPEYSTADVSNMLYERMEELEEKYNDISFAVLMDQGEYVNMMVGTIANNLIFGGILAVFVLFIFLKSSKPTLIVGASILISVITAFVMMYFAGISLNIISLCGLALSVGMLVDNSIVVIENIFRLRSNGVEPKAAAIEGARQMTGAITASTLTTIVVFVPIIFTQGLTRQLFTDMALTIVFSLIASLVVALTLVPMASAGMLKNTVYKKNKLFDKITAVYVKSLERVLKYRAVSIIIVVVLLIASIFAAVSQGTELFPATDSGSVSVSLEVPEDYDREQRFQLLDKTYEILSGVEDIETIGIIDQGDSGAISIMGGGGVSINILLSNDRKSTTDENAEIIRRLAQDNELNLSVSNSASMMSFMSGGQVVLNVLGTNLDDLQDTAQRLAHLVENIEGTTEIDNGLGKPTSELRIIVDKEKAAQHNLTVAQVYMQIAEKFKNPTSITNITDNITTYAVYVTDDRDLKLTSNDVLGIEITLPDNTTVKVGDIAEVGKHEGFASISRTSDERTLSITASITTGYNTGKINDEIEKQLQNFTPTGNCRVEVGGESESTATAFRDLYLMMALAIVFIYLVMVAQFQSMLSPFIVMFTIPLAFTGGFFGLAICSMPTSLISLIGLIILVGVVVNNGIVYISCVNELRNRGMEIKESLLQAAILRIRPIIMTSLTTIIALLISAFDSSAGGALTRPVSVTVIGGLIYSTVLTLFFVPIMYSVFHRKNKNKDLDSKIQKKEVLELIDSGLTLHNNGLSTSECFDENYYNQYDKQEAPTDFNADKDDV